MLMRRSATALVVLLLISVAGCGARAPSAAMVLHRGLAGEPSTLDPAAAVDSFSHDVMRDVFEGLTVESPTGAVAPGVAATWSVDASGTEYRFELRHDARWSNGAPVRAQDFIAAWQRVLDPKQASPVADALRLIVGASAILEGKAPPSALGVAAPSDTELVVHLARPAPYLPQLLTHAAAYPVYAGHAPSHEAAAWVSNGPYVLASWSPGTAVTLKKNPQYWDRQRVAIDTVVYAIVPNDESQYARYRAGELDMTDTVPSNAVAAIRQERPQELVIAPFLATCYYGLNVVNGPLAGNVKLRQALAMAIDRKRLVEQLGFGQVPAYQFVPPGTWNYGPQTWDWKDSSDAERIAHARRLYAEAGYSVQAPLRLRVLFNANPGIRDTAIVIAAMWKEVLGIDSALDSEEYRVFLQSRHDKARWDVARLAWSADYDDAGNFLDTLRSDSPNNDEGYTNAAFDGALQQAAQTADPRARRAFLETGEARMLADYPVVPLYFFVTKRLVKPYVTGLQLNPLNHIGSKGLAVGAH